VGTGGTGGNGGTGGDGGKGGKGDDGNSQHIYDSNSGFASGTSIPNTYTPVSATRNQGCNNSIITITKPGSTPNWDMSGLPISFVSDLLPPSFGSSSQSTSASSNTAYVYFNTTAGSSVTAYNLKISSTTYRGFLNLAINRPSLPTITAQEPLGTTLTLPTQHICEGKQVFFSTEATALAYEWKWVKGGASPTSPADLNGGSATANATHIFTSPGTYYVKVKVKDECCGWAVPTWVTIIVDPLPSGTITFTSSTGSWSFCQNSQAVVTLGGGSDITSYDWSGTSVLVASTIDLGVGNGSQVTVTFGSTTGNLEVQPKNACGDHPSTFTQTSTILPQPVAQISGPTSICDGVAHILQNVVAGYPGYSWSPGGDKQQILLR